MLVVGCENVSETMHGTKWLQRPDRVMRNGRARGDWRRRRALKQSRSMESIPILMSHSFSVTCCLLRCSSDMAVSTRIYRCFLLWLLVCLGFGAYSRAVAQPSLSFKRITVNWPTIELYVAYHCDGQLGFDPPVGLFRLFENGEEIREFTQWCPNRLGYKCALSIGLVMDASGSMRGEELQHAKSDASSIIDLLDGMYDEGVLLLAGVEARLAVPFTSNKAALDAGIHATRAEGATALYDAIHAAIEEMVSGGTNQCRAILVFTDGGDNASAETLQNIITLANRNRIRVFTFVYGEHGPTLDMELLAQLTGGKFYQNPSVLNLTSVYQEIGAILWPVFHECILTYDRTCADGGMRTVEVQLVDYCNGSDAKTRTYRAPLDSSTFSRLDVILPATQLEALRPTRIPIMLDGATADIERFELSLRYDDAVDFLGVSTPPDALLHGRMYHVNQSPGRIFIQSAEAIRLDGEARLLDLVFLAKRAGDSLLVDVALDAMYIPGSCLSPVLKNNPILVVERLRPLITASQREFCVGDSITLEANDGFERYLWSTGDTTQSIRVFEGGMYSLTVVDVRGDSLRAEPMVVTRYDLPRVRIIPDGPLDICRGREVMLSLSGDTADCTIQWSNTRSSKSVQINAAGSYWATVTSPHGCVANSDTVTVTVSDIPVRVQPGYDIQLCPGDSVILSVEGRYDHIRWRKQDQETYTVHWGSYGSTWVRAMVTDSNGCVGTSDTIRITMLPRYIPTVSPAGTVELCPGGSVELTADSGYVAYRWSTGDSTQRIRVDVAGDYVVQVEDAYGCRAWSDTVRVLSVASPSPRINAVEGPVYCGGEALTLDAGANYLAWRWNTGAVTQTISVTDSGAYWVEVTGIGGCTGVSDTINVKNEDMTEGFTPALRGSSPLCPGDTLWLDAPDGMRAWVWNTGSRQRSLAVTSAGRYAVTALTPGGCEIRSSIVDVSMIPAAIPTITRTGDLLRTDSARSWQWYLDGLPIAGATERFYHARATGSYTVRIVDEHGCTLVSPAFVVSVLSVTVPDEVEELIMYPEPTRGTLNIIFPQQLRQARISLYSLLGQLLLYRDLETVTATREAHIDISNIPAGVYVLHVHASTNSWFRNVVVLQ
jgi:hypothetical protein